MKEDKFIKENIEVWRSLEQTLKKLRSKGFHKFEKDELDSFITQYNSTCGHLSYCRTYYGETATTAYLNRLVAAAHNCIYTTKTSNLKKLGRFFTVDFPGLLRRNARYFWISTALFLLGFLVSFVYTLISPDNAAAFIPRETINGIDFSGSTDKWWDGSIMSSFILTNNIRVGFSAFALGITLGIGTSVVLIYNGFMLGTIAALAWHSNATYRFWALILPHGVLELFAIFVCGAAGIIIGYSIIYPRVYSRKDSFIMRGRAGVRLVCGTIPIFVVAGLIEGFVTPQAIPEVWKYLVALVTLGGLVTYLVLAKRKKNSENNTR